tara:strand:- start:79 stop:459 length:381 start_codon:yes stop_codon:yes gene_type:complete
MIIYEYFTLFCTILFFPLIIYFFIKHFKNHSKKNRIEENIKLYYDDDFKQCIEIISKRLNNTEFEKVSDVLYNLMRGYDYGFTDSINFAFYNEMKLIKSKVRKIRPNKISKLKVVNNNLNNNSNVI